MRRKERKIPKTLEERIFREVAETVVPPTNMDENVIGKSWTWRDFDIEAKVRMASYDCLDREARDRSKEHGY